MNFTEKHMPFITSATLMCLVLVVVYPHYQYYVDPDGTAYLTIAARYAAGDFAKAVNGYWSPWSCWLTAGLIRSGIAPVPSGVIINTLGAAGFLFITNSFFIKFGIHTKLLWLFNTALSLFLCYAIFWQSFDDLWECFFLLSTLRIMLTDGFKNNALLWVACGIIGALAYFAKAYAFPFFILNTLVCTYFICKDNKTRWLKSALTAILVMVVCSLPWIMALHDKYHIWTTSTSGSLNMSWYLVGHPYWKQGINQLIPPFYPDSPYYWEDPYWANGATPHFWDSWQLFGRQLLRIIQNLYKLTISMAQLSLFFPLIAFMTLGFINRKRKSTPDASFIASISFFLFPLGYILVNFEARYIWYMLPLGLIIAGLFIQNHLAGKKYASLISWALALSLIVYPAWGMFRMYDQGKEDFIISEKLKKLNIHGSFTAITKPGLESQSMERIAYFSGNQLFSIPAQDAKPAAILEEMRRYHVKYFFAYRSAAGAPFHDELGRPFPEITQGAIPGLSIFLIDP